MVEGHGHHENLDHTQQVSHETARAATRAMSIGFMASHLVLQVPGSGHLAVFGTSTLSGWCRRHGRLMCKWVYDGRECRKEWRGDITLRNPHDGFVLERSV